MDDLYLVLGVELDATPEEIRERFRFLAQAYHPDKFSSPAQKLLAEEEFKKINNAYQILSNPHKRAEYDLQRKRATNTSRNSANDVNRRAEESARQQAEDERRKRAEEAARQQAQAERKRKAEKTARQQAEDEKTAEELERAKRNIRNREGRGFVRLSSWQWIGTAMVGLMIAGLFYISFQIKYSSTPTLIVKSTPTYKVETSSPPGGQNLKPQVLIQMN